VRWGGGREGSSLLARVVPVADRQGGAVLYMVLLNESGPMEQIKRRKGRAEPDDDGGWAGALTLVVDDAVKKRKEVSVALQPGDFRSLSGPGLIRASLAKPLWTIRVTCLMLIMRVNLDNSNPNGRSGPQNSSLCALATRDLKMKSAGLFLRFHTNVLQAG
jgi:hypothetical protein